MSSGETVTTLLFFTTLQFPYCAVMCYWYTDHPEVIPVREGEMKSFGERRKEGRKERKEGRREDMIYIGNTYSISSKDCGS